ncbi:ead/Ea22-like family protein [Cronobacter malonaticus]
MATQLDVTTAALREKTKQCEQLAAENAALRDINEWCKTDAFKNMYREFKTAESLGCLDVDCMHDAMLTAIMHAPKTPATDAFLREVKAQARKDGAHFVANRMLAAWDAGFIDDTAKNAADIARMILTSTEFMADAPEGDFERAFADGVLADIAAQLREGGDA